MGVPVGCTVVVRGGKTVAVASGAGDGLAVPEQPLNNANNESSTTTTDIFFNRVLPYITTLFSMTK